MKNEFDLKSAKKSLKWSFMKKGAENVYRCDSGYV